MPSIYNDNIGDILRNVNFDIQPQNPQGVVLPVDYGLWFVPYIHFVSNTTANNQQFVSEYLVRYTDDSANASLFINGVFTLPTDWSISGNTATINVLLNPDDNVDILLRSGSGLTYGDANVISLLQTYTGNLSAGNANIASNVTVGNSIFVNNLRYSNGQPWDFEQYTNYSNSNVANYLEVYTGNIAARSITASQNISAQFFLGNGRNLTGLDTYGNADVAVYLTNSFLPSYNGNLRAGYANFTIGNITNSLDVGGVIRPGSIQTDNYFYANGVPIIFGGNTNVNVSSAVTQIVAGTNISVDPANGLGIVTVTNTYGDANVQANVSAFLPSFTGNIRANNFIAGNSILTDNIRYANGQPWDFASAAGYGNANVAAFLPTYTGNVQASSFIATTSVLTNSLRYANNQPWDFASAAGYGNANVQAYLPTYSGNILNLGITGNLKIGPATERVVVAGTPAATQTYDVIPAAVYLFTGTTNTNQTLNIRGNSTTSLNSYMNTGESLTIAYIITNGATGYWPSTLQIDGATQTVLYAGGTPTSGNPNSTDGYTYTIIKRGASTYTVLGSQTRYA